MSPQKSEVLFDDAAMKIEWLPGESDKILLCFTGIGHSMGGLDVQGPEFAGTGLNFGTPVFLYDKKRSWGNALDFDVMARVLAPIVAGRTVVSMGNSMGAFLAIAATQYVPISRCFAFAPQFSVDPTVLPKENRWARYRDQIETFRLPSLAQSFNDTCEYFIFSGATPRERLHWENFPVAGNIHSFILPDSDHDIALDLKASERLNALMQICMTGRPTDRALCRTFGFALPGDIPA
jgi:hypothetical protein